MIAAEAVHQLEIRKPGSPTLQLAPAETALAVPSPGRRPLPACGLWRQSGPPLQESLSPVAARRSSAYSSAYPEAGSPRADGEAFVQQPLRIGGFACREIAHVADPLHMIPADAQNLAAQVQNLQLGRVLPKADPRIAGAPVATELAYDNWFALRGHRFGLSHGVAGPGREKQQIQCTRA